MLPSQTMLIRRRHSLLDPSPESVSDKSSEAADRKKHEERQLNKLKMSPFPEVEGHSLHRPHPKREIDNRRSEGKVNEVKTTLFKDIEEADSALSSPTIYQATPLTSKAPPTSIEATPTSMFVPVSPLTPPLEISDKKLDKEADISSDEVLVVANRASMFQGGNLRPTHVLALDNNLAPKTAVVPNRHSDGSDRGSQRRISKGRRVSRGANSDDVPSAQTRSMWDSVVSWMKMAVDFVAVDSTTAEATPSPTNTIPHRKKRLLGEYDLTDPPTRKHSRSSGEATKRYVGGDSCEWRRGRGKNRTGFSAPSGAGLNDGLGQILALEPIQEENSHSNSNGLMRTDRLNSDSCSASSPSSQLAQKLSETLSVLSPNLKTRHQARRTGMKLNSALPHLQSIQFGLNSILDGSPVPVPSIGTRSKKIRRKSLRSFYGNSVYSPNLIQVPVNDIAIRRSCSQGTAEVSGVPVPPPPPPIVPRAPPPPPLQSSTSGFHSVPASSHPPPGGSSSSSSEEHSRDILNQMQMRLRSRIGKKGAGNSGKVGGDGVLGGGTPKKVDIKIRQWAEIQAHGLKLPLEDFLSLAEKKKEELQTSLEELERSVPSTLHSISQTVELIQEGATWFPGGSKEMRDTLPLYKKMERKIETLNEFVQVYEEMNRAITEGILLGVSQDLHHYNLCSTLLHIREDFDSKDRRWRSVIATNAESWIECGLPVCHTLLARSCDHMCGLASRFVSLCLKEVPRLTGILLSMKCTRTTQLKEKLRESLNLILETHFYFTFTSSTSCNTCDHCTSKPALLSDGGGGDSGGSDDGGSAGGGGGGGSGGGGGGDGDGGDGGGGSDGGGDGGDDGGGSGDGGGSSLHTYNTSFFLSLAVQVTVAYIDTALHQFDGYVLRTDRQCVSGHFEGILKVLSVVKSILSAISGTKMGVARTTGVCSLLPNGDELGEVLYSSCVRLIQHIVGWTQPCMTVELSPLRKEKHSKEVVLWMMFGCKYVNQTLEFLGSEGADQRGVADLLEKLQQMEDLLPDYNNGSS